MKIVKIRCGKTYPRVSCLFSSFDITPALQWFWTSKIEINSINKAMYLSFTMKHCYLLVMGRTAFIKHRTNLSIIFQTSKGFRMFSSISDRTQTPYFWLQTIEHRTSNLIGLSLDLLNYSSNWLQHHFFEHQTNLNLFIYW